MQLWLVWQKMGGKKVIEEMEFSLAWVPNEKMIVFVSWNCKTNSTLLTYIVQNYSQQKGDIHNLVGIKIKDR